MLIESLELKYYKRLLLRSINHIKIEPKSKIQLILGTNSSGKSSLLRELSPLPADPANYLKGGYKIIKIIYNNSYYILKSLFDPDTGNKFHFIKDDIELNPGNTVTVFKELVKSHFYLDNTIHEVLIGSTKFHSMSVAERRNWFTRISDTDYTYAISFYQRLKDQLRDVQGALKINQSKLVSESNKLISEEEEKKYLEEIKELNNVITILLDMKSSSFISKDKVINELEEIESNLNNLSINLLTNKKKFDNKYNFSSIEDIDNFIISTKSDINEYNNRNTKLLEEIDVIEKSKILLEKSNIDSFKDIDKNISIIEKQIENSKKQLSIKLVFEDNERCLDTLISLLPNLNDIFSELEVNKDKKYNPNYYNLLLEKIKLTNIKIKDRDDLLNRYISDKKTLEHLKEHNNVECPKCNHKWIKDYSEKDYKRTISNIDTVVKEIEKLNKELSDLEEELEKTKNYLNLFRNYNNISKNCAMLNPIWNYLYDNNIIFNQPERINNILNSIQLDLEMSVYIDSLYIKLKEFNNIKNTISENQELDINNIINKINSLNKEVYNNSLIIKNKKLLLEELESYKQICISIFKYKEDIEDLLSLRDNKIKILEDVNRRNFINEVIQNLRLQLSSKERVISQTSIQKGIVDNLNKQASELEEKLEILKIAIKELSPTEGLIAKGLTGFINQFVQHMNLFINKVWLYPIEVVPITIEEDELDLDYKFSVKINDIPGNDIADISKGSTSVRDIIDLAFRIVSMKYLNLSNYPLYLDELGASFDKSHRDAVSRLIHSLTHSTDYSQVFIISHYSETYGSFKNTDITVLCNENIDLPKDCLFNKNTKIN